MSETLTEASSQWEYEETERLLNPLFGQPAGTMERVRPGIWLIQGDRNQAYEVDLGEVTCQCPQHRHRMVAGEKCKHARSVFEQLQAKGLVPCPGCQHEGRRCGWCGGEVMVTKDEAEVIGDYVAVLVGQVRQQRDEDALAPSADERGLKRQARDEGLKQIFR